MSSPHKGCVVLVDNNDDRVSIKNKWTEYTKDDTIAYTKNSTFAYTKDDTCVKTKYHTDKGNDYPERITRDYHGNTIGKTGSSSF